jgi:hypothetical protein
MKDLIKRGRVVVTENSPEESPPGNVAIENMTKAQLVEVIQQAQPDFEPGKMTKAQLVEVYQTLINVPEKTPAENETGGDPETETGQENQE